MQTVAIAGVGLIGGSFGLALRRAGFAGKILGVSSPDTIRKAIERSAVDEGVSLEEAAVRADLLLLAQPVSAILEALRTIAPLVRPDCLVTDVGSTKSRIVEQARDIPLFLGGHPMAGKESSGIDAADPDLFGIVPILTPEVDAGDIAPKARALIDYIRSFRAVPVFLSPAIHDRTVAFTSHLPQLISTALARLLHEQLTPDQLVSVSGPGLKDLTRLAMSPWAVWQDIIDTNADSIQHALTVYIDTLTEIRDNLQTQRTGEDFRLASEVARSIRRGL